MRALVVLECIQLFEGTADIAPSETQDLGRRYVAMRSKKILHLLSQSLQTKSKPDREHENSDKMEV